MPGLSDALTEIIELKDEKTQTIEKIRVPKKALKFTKILADWKSKNYYQILDIDPSKKQRFKPLSEAIIASLRKTFRMMARLFHPDKSSSFNIDSTDKSEESQAYLNIFKLFNEAYSTLIEEKSIEQYDLEQTEISFNRDSSQSTNDYFEAASSAPSEPSAPKYSGNRAQPFPASDPYGRAHYYAESQAFAQNKSQQPPKPLTPIFLKWQQFTQTIVDGQKIKPYIALNSAEINTLFKKEISETFSENYNALRVAIEAEAYLHVKHLLLLGAKFDCINYTTKSRLLLDVAFCKAIENCALTSEELITVLLADQQAIEACNTPIFVKLLTHPSSLNTANLMKLVKKIKDNEIGDIYKKLVIDGNTEGLNILMNAVPEMRPHLMKSYPLESLHYQVTKIKSYSAYYALIKTLIGHGLLINYPQQQNPTTDYCITDNNLPFLRALLNCGALLEDDSFKEVETYSRTLLPSYKKAIDYLARLPKSYLNFQAFIKSILSMLQPLSNQFIEGLMKDIFKEIHHYFINYKLEINEFHAAAVNLLIDNLFELLNNECKRAEQDSAFITTAMNRYQQLKKIVSLYPLLALAYGFVGKINRPLPTVEQGAVRLLLNRTRNQHGDYVVCYNSTNGNSMVVYYDKGTIYNQDVTPSCIGIIQTIPLHNLIHMDIKELFKLRFDNQATILHMNALYSGHLHGENKPLKELLVYAEQVRPFVNLQTDTGTTALHLAARHEMNGSICKRLIDLGADIKIRSAEFGLVSEYGNVSYIAELVELVKENDQELQRDLLEQERKRKRTSSSQPSKQLIQVQANVLTIGMSSRQKRENILQQFTQEYRKYANKAASVGRINLAILDKQSVSTNDLANANKTTMLCAIAVENFSLIIHLIGREPQLLDGDGFTVALLTDNLKLIEMISRYFHYSRYPENIVELLSLCSPEVQKFITAKHDASKQFLQVQSLADERKSNELLGNALNSQLSPKEASAVSMPNEPVAMDVSRHKPSPGRI